MRRLLFGLSVTALAIVSFFLAVRGRAPGTPAPPRVSIKRSARSADSTLRGPSAPGRAAHRFLTAFLDYEAGARDPSTVSRIRRGSVRSLSSEVLAAPPSASGARPTDPSSLAWQVSRLPHRPGVALVSGTARRPSGPEPFAFLFARRGARWLAVAPAE